MPQEVEKIIAWVNESPARLKAFAKQLRYWNNSPLECPFLDKDKRCFVYPVRPFVCETFGHVPCMECHKGVQFAPWAPDVEHLSLLKHGVLEGSAEIIVAGHLGAVLLKAVKSPKGGVASADMGICMTIGMYNRLVEQAREAREERYRGR